MAKLRISIFSVVAIFSLVVTINLVLLSLDTRNTSSGVVSIDSNKDLNKAFAVPKTTKIEMLAHFNDFCETVEKNGIKIKYYCNSHMSWWWRDVFPTWEPESFLFIDTLKEPCLVCIGEWIGPIALYFGLKYPGRKLIIFEPNPIAYHTLISNLNLNEIRSYTLFLNAVTPENKGYRFKNMWSSGGSYFHETDHPAFGPSPKWYVSGVTFDRVFKGREECAFKMDIEGGEQDVLTQMIELDVFKKMSSFSISPHPQFWNRDLEEIKQEYRLMMDEFTFTIGGEGDDLRIVPIPDDLRNTTFAGKSEIFLFSNEYGEEYKTNGLNEGIK